MLRLLVAYASRRVKYGEGRDGHAAHWAGGGCVLLPRVEGGQPALAAHGRVLTFPEADVRTPTIVVDRNESIQKTSNEARDWTGEGKKERGVGVQGATPLQADAACVSKWLQFFAHARRRAPTARVNRPVDSIRVLVLSLVLGLRPFGGEGHGAVSAQPKL